MTHIPFASDTEWVKFRLLELAVESNKGMSAEEYVLFAEVLMAFVLPQAEIIDMQEGKNAAKKRK